MALKRTQDAPAVHSRLAEKIEKMGDRQDKWLSGRERRATLHLSNSRSLSGRIRSFLQDGGLERPTVPDKHTPPVDDTSMAGLELTAPRPSVDAEIERKEGEVLERELHFEVEEDSEYSSIQV